MKDEANGKIITEFVGLRSKMYSVRIQGSNTIKKAKGVKTSVVKSMIDFEDYLSCLRNNEPRRVSKITSAAGSTPYAQRSRRR